MLGEGVCMALMRKRVDLRPDAAVTFSAGCIANNHNQPLFQQALEDSPKRPIRMRHSSMRLCDVC